MNYFKGVQAFLAYYMYKEQIFLGIVEGMCTKVTELCKPLLIIIIILLNSPEEDELQREVAQIPTEALEQASQLGKEAFSIQFCMSERK